MKLLKLYFITGFVFILLDAIWLGFLANSFYINQLRPLLNLKNGAIQANMTAVILVYLVLISGLVFFVQPLAQGHIYLAITIGAFYGLVTYGTYDFTNMAVLKDWNWLVVWVDVAWGMVLCAVSSAVACWLK